MIHSSSLCTIDPYLIQQDVLHASVFVNNQSELFSLPVLGCSAALPKSAISEGFGKEFIGWVIWSFDLLIHIIFIPGAGATTTTYSHRRNGSLGLRSYRCPWPHGGSVLVPVAICKRSGYLGRRWVGISTIYIPTRKTWKT